MMADVRRVTPGRSWLVFAVAVAMAVLPICGLACAFPVDESPGQAEVSRSTHCAAHAGSDPRSEHGSNQNAPEQPCNQSHLSGVNIGSAPARAVHAAHPAVLIAHSSVPRPERAQLVAGPSVVSISPSFSPLAVTLRL